MQVSFQLPKSTTKLTGMTIWAITKTFTTIRVSTVSMRPPLLLIPIVTDGHTVSRSQRTSSNMRIMETAHHRPHCTQINRFTWWRGPAFRRTSWKKSVTWIQFSTRWTSKKCNKGSETSLWSPIKDLNKSSKKIKPTSQKIKSQPVCSTLTCLQTNRFLFRRWFRRLMTYSRLTMKMYLGDSRNVLKVYTQNSQT